MLNMLNYQIFFNKANMMLQLLKSCLLFTKILYAYKTGHFYIPII